MLESPCRRGRAREGRELLYVLSVDAANQRGSVRDSLEEARQLAYANRAPTGQLDHEQRAAALTRQLEACGPSCAHDGAPAGTAPGAGRAVAAASRIAARRQLRLAAGGDKTEEGARRARQSPVTAAPAHHPARELDVQTRLRELCHYWGENRRGGSTATSPSWPGPDRVRRSAASSCAATDVLSTAVLALPASQSTNVALASLLPAGKPPAERSCSRPRARSAWCSHASACQCATRPSRTRSSACTAARSCRCRARRCSRPSWPSQPPRRAPRQTTDVPTSPSRSTGRRFSAGGHEAGRLVPGMQLDADVLLEQRRL